MEWIIDNIEWLLEWLFGGVGVTALGYAGNKIFKKKEVLSKDVHKQTQNNNQQQTATINMDPRSKHSDPVIRNQADIKATRHILFIDDEKFSMIGILKSAGWNNVQYKKDITNLDCDEVKWAHIIFVDINGVGCKLFKNQGLGLGVALKAKYKSKKVVIYSAETTGDRFDENLRKVDACLPKNAEPIQFSNLIEDLCNA